MPYDFDGAFGHNRDVVVAGVVSVDRKFISGFMEVINRKLKPPEDDIFGLGFRHAHTTWAGGLGGSGGGGGRTNVPFS